MVRYRLSNLKDFSMRTVVEVFHRDRGYVFGYILYPKCWEFKDKLFYMTEEQFDKEYMKAEGPWLNNDFWGNK